MAMISCPECSTDVSDTALTCPKCGVQLRKPKRGFFGTLFKWIFILFNLLMVGWLISYFGSIGELANTTGSEAGKAGAAIGGAIGTGMILGIWAVGDVILGALVMFTRPKS